MSNASHIRHAVFMAAFVLVGSAASAQNSQTVCSNNGGVVTCNTTQQPTRAPLDYGKTLQQGQDLVPTVQRRPSPPPVQYTPPARQVSPPPVKSAPRTPIWRAKGFAEVCRSSDPTEMVICSIYLDGIMEGHRGAWAAAGVDPVYCIPSAISANAQRTIAADYIDARDGMQGVLTGSAVLAAFKAAFPCPPK